MKTFILSFIMLVSSFSVQKNPADKLSWYVQRQFMVVQMPGFIRDQLMDSRTEIDLTILPKAGVYIYGDSTYVSVKINAVNSIHFSLKNKHSKTSDSRAVDIKSKLMRLLPTINRYKRDGHFIMLYSNEKMLIKAIAKDWD